MRLHLHHQSQHSTFWLDVNSWSTTNRPENCHFSFWLLVRGNGDKSVDPTFLHLLFHKAPSHTFFNFLANQRSPDCSLLHNMFCCTLLGAQIKPMTRRRAVSNEGSLGITRSYPPHAPLLLSICRIYEFSWPFSWLTFQKEPAHTDAAASQCSLLFFFSLFILSILNLFQYNSNVQLQNPFMEGCSGANIYKYTYMPTWKTFFFSPSRLRLDWLVAFFDQDQSKLRQRCNNTKITQRNPAAPVLHGLWSPEGHGPLFLVNVFLNFIKKAVGEAAKCRRKSPC